jgi:hypothetical protein
LERDGDGIAKILTRLKMGGATKRSLQDDIGLSRERLARLLGMLTDRGDVEGTNTTVRGNPCRIYSLKRDVGDE